MNIKKFITSLGYACAGFKIAWRDEQTFRIDVIGGLLALGLGFLLHLTPVQFSLIFIVCGLVLATEAINTALEELCDTFQSKEDPHIAKIKDLGAAASLLASLAALGVGIVIFVPAIFAALSAY